MDSKRIQHFIDRAEVVEALTTFIRAVETLDWDTCRTIVAETIIADHGTPEALSRDAAIERWRMESSVVDRIHSVTTDHLVTIDGDLAKCKTQFITTMLVKGAPSGDVWTLGGSSEYDLKRTDEGWKLAGAKAIILWSTGNVNIIKEAVERAGKPLTPAE